MTTRRKNIAEPKWLLVGVFFVAGAFGGAMTTYLYLSTTAAIPIKLHLKGSYQFINPTLSTEPSSQSNFSSISQDLTLKIKGIVDSTQHKGDTSVGVYFRDLEPGTSLAINADNTFTPGKLLKIPLMIAYYKVAQHQPGLLQQKITIDKMYPNEDILAPKSRLQTGSTYSAEELVGEMITRSDDTAANILFDTINKDALNEIFSDVGIDFTENNTSLDFISLRRYSLFFRLLYNANYLTPEYSERALSLLVDTPTTSFLEANLPHSIVFASRIGGSSFIDQGVRKVNVYECDIVYFPDHNYLLCALGTSARDRVSDIQNVFTDIGNAIYEDMHYRYGK